jgi:hypothetical protein
MDPIVYVTPTRIDIAIFLLAQARSLIDGPITPAPLQSQVAQALANKAAELVTTDAA